ncbi:MAG TPA: hypothetical protein VGL53_07775 [Bryobacteraceae bacterium]|jgi:hypothetical protein
MKRTTFMVDEALLEEAKTVLGAKNYSETLAIALRESISAFRVRNLTTYFGTGIWKGDLDEMRGRPKSAMTRKAQVGK